MDSKFELKKNLAFDIINKFDNNYKTMMIDDVYQLFKDQFLEIEIQAESPELADFINSIGYFYVHKRRVHYSQDSWNQAKFVETMYNSDHQFAGHDRKMEILQNLVSYDQSDDDDGEDPFGFGNKSSEEIMCAGDFISESDFTSDVEIGKAEIIQIITLDGSLDKEICLHFHFDRQIKMVKEIMKELIKSYHDDHQYTIPMSKLRPEMYCAVLYDCLWHRGLITNVYDTQVEVFLIDFGNLIQVSRVCVKYLLKKFQDYPMQKNSGTLVEIHEDEDFKNNEFFYEVEVLGVEGNIYSLKYLARTDIALSPLNVAKILLDAEIDEF